jgi:hypothetical protein
MSNNKQSSVEWFAQKLYETLEIRGDGYVIDSLLDLAKAMHKQECVDLLNHHNDIFDTSEEHYNKTFGGNNEYICPKTTKQCDDECCVSADECHIEAQSPQKK